MKVISGLKELELLVQKFCVCLGDTLSVMRAPRRSVRLSYHERNHVDDDLIYMMMILSI